MEFTAEIVDGRIVLPQDCALPDGTMVAVRVVDPSADSTTTKATRERLVHPLVPSNRPGQIFTTPELVDRILNDMESSVDGDEPNNKVSSGR